MTDEPQLEESLGDPGSESNPHAVIDNPGVPPEEPEAETVEEPPSAEHLSDAEVTEEFGTEELERPAPQGSGFDESFTLEGIIHPSNPFRSVRCASRPHARGVSLAHALEFAQALCAKLDNIPR